MAPSLKGMVSSKPPWHGAECKCQWLFVPEQSLVLVSHWVEHLGRQHDVGTEQAKAEFDPRDTIELHDLGQLVHLSGLNFLTCKLG